MEVRIVVTDDALFMRSIIKDILIKYSKSYEVLEASTGQELLDVLKTHKVNLVTLDVTMPGMDGIETLKEVRAIQPEVPVIMVTAMGQSPFVKEALALGANDFIVKPFKAVDVIEAVNRALKNARK